MPDTSRWRRHPAPETRDPGNPGTSSQVSIGARSRADVARQRDLAARGLARAAGDKASRDVRWDQGIFDAARWALGEVEVSPITRTYVGGVPDAAALRVEDDAAYAAIKNSSFAYEVAVQHTLMWVRGLTADSPAIEYED
jgi:hypothetical protein